ncbi:MAG: DUF5723 family protein [Bacteroidales bacterium]|nr:DUF5723 family protein [Bacteroidales bacterium]
MKKYIKNTLTTAITMVLAAFTLINTANGQFDRSLTFLPVVPQSRNINIGFIPDHKYYIGVPLLSSVKTGFENSINYDDIFLRKGDSLVLDRDHIMSNIDDITRVNINLMEEYLTFGFKIKKNYFHFRVGDLIESNIAIDRDMLQFLLYGNGSEEFLGKNVEIHDNLFNLNYYREYSLGYTRQVNEKLNLGLNLKYLQGIANLSTDKTEISLFTDHVDFTFSVKTNMDINISSPGIDNSDVQPGDFLPNTKNKGFAFDLGGQYMINQDFRVFASLLNIGSIKWTENLKNFKTLSPEQTFSFDGFDIQEFFENNEFDNQRVDEILDSIVDEIGIRETAEPYKTKLAPQLNLGGHYYLSPKDQFSVLFRNQFLKTKDWTTVSIGYTRMLGEHVNLMVSNSFFTDSYFNPGIGFAAGIGPVQLYLINENIVAPFMLNNSNVFLVRFGINLIFNKSPGNAEDIEVIHE